MNLYSEMKDIQLTPLLLLRVVLGIFSMDLTQVLVMIQQTGIKELQHVTEVKKSMLKLF